jgi:hypothetical protein
MPGAAILAIAFLAKAGLWPLNFWLPPAYAAASAPAAAVFAILTKVGVYAVLRLWTLCFPADAGASTGFGGGALVWGGIVTLAFGAVGMLASQQLARLAGYAVIASSGSLVAAIGFAAPALSGGALFYLASSTLAGCALFLLVELLERARQVEVGRSSSTTATTALARVPGRRAAARRESRRRRAGADRPRDPGRTGLPGRGLHGLRAGDGRPAAVVGLRGQAGHADGAARAAFAGGLDAVHAD